MKIFQQTFQPFFFETNFLSEIQLISIKYHHPFDESHSKLQAFPPLIKKEKIQNEDLRRNSSNIP